MAKKEIAISKRAKISKAQQNMLLAVLGTGLVLGATIAVVSYCIKLINFNARIIIAKDQAIVDYSETIKNTGVCKKPSGDVYTVEELKKCDPKTLNASDVPGTLRANILNVLAADESLAMVPSKGGDDCRNPETDKQYTYKELSDKYNKAKTDEEITAATNLIKSCSALRLVPDALPSHQNEEALLASLNKIFNMSGWQPESIAPASSWRTYGTEIQGLNPLTVNLSIKADADQVYTVLNNIEHSIREFDIRRAKIESRENGLEMSAQATAYWVEPTYINEVREIIPVEEKNGGKK
ncbi:MAG: hypothetical protein Q4A33_01915 [Candidatus Saccharibacteria bacterium]|nr:hypothetical protein [Candidatus Saccharibacteria bacterium]